MYLRPVDPAAQAGTKVEMLGSYALLSPLASGSLTTLHRARSSAAKDGDAGHCVIKRLQRRYVNDAELRSLLLATGRAALRVSSPDVVRTLEVHEAPEPFLVLEYLNGADLHTLLRAAGSDDVTRYALPILLDVLDGLQVLHELRTETGAPAGLVHGAPCARHIMVGHDGMGRLVDLTHAVGPGLPWAPRRDERLIPSEMAPEQALAPAHVDPRCDQFIVGSLLWEVLTGKSLFASDDADASLRNLLRSGIPAPSEAGSSAGRSFDRICQRALQRSRADRFESASEMGGALREEAARAGLLASREDVGAWVRGLSSQPAPRLRDPVVTNSTKRHTIMGWQAELPNAAAPSVRPGRSTPTLSFTQRDFMTSVTAAQAAAQSAGEARTESAPVAVPATSIDASASGARFVPNRPLARESQALGSVAPQALGSVVPFTASSPLSSAPHSGTSSALPSGGESLDAPSFPSMWQKPQSSFPPEPEPLPRRALVNKPAMFTGIAIALVIPAVVLALMGETKSEPQRHERPSMHRQARAAEPAPVAEPAGGGTLEAFARQQALAPAPAVPPSAPDPEVERAEPSPSTAMGAADPVLETPPRRAPRAEPRQLADAPATTPSLSAPGGRRGKREQVEGLPINPY